MSEKNKAGREGGREGSGREERRRGFGREKEKTEKGDANFNTVMRHWFCCYG